MGRLIVIEGACDGIGKSTQYELLSTELEKRGDKLSKHHFPSYDTYHGEPVERYLKGEYGTPNELSPYFINTLYATDRAITWHTKLKKDYNEGKTILLDRYTTSSLIYQSALIEDVEEKKKFLDYVTDFEYNKLEIKEPDTVIFLYADFDLVTEIRNKRKQNDGVQNDIHERNLKFMRKVYNSGMFVADYLNWTKIKCDEGNRLRTKKEIHKDILKQIYKIKTYEL